MRHAAMHLARLVRGRRLFQAFVGVLAVTFIASSTVPTLESFASARSTSSSAARLTSPRRAWHVPVATWFLSQLALHLDFVPAPLGAQACVSAAAAATIDSAIVVIAAAAEAGALEEAETELHHPMDDEHST